MRGGDFLDSNVLLYLFDSTDPAKRHAAESLVQSAVATGAGAISVQVAQETLNVLTRGITPAASADECRRFMNDVLAPLWRVMPTQALYERALDIHARYRYAFYDALIVAAAISAGCSRLLSEDLQHGQRIEGLTIQNPFV